MGRGALWRSDGPIPQQNRQMKHISAEQKRRFNIKMGFDTLNSLISNNTKLVSGCGGRGRGWVGQDRQDGHLGAPGVLRALTQRPRRPATPSRCRRLWSTSPSCSRSAVRCRRRPGGFARRSRSSTPPSCEAGPGGGVGGAAHPARMAGREGGGLAEAPLLGTAALVLPPTLGLPAGPPAPPSSPPLPVVSAPASSCSLPRASPSPGASLITCETCLTNM